MSDPSITNDWPKASAIASVPWPTIPGYEILSELGRGGMGVVYQARHLGSQELVALKLIRDGALAGPQERGRFRIEAEAAARMRHPNIIQIHEVGEHEGRPYFAMELVTGGSLDKLLARRPQPAREAAVLVRTLAIAIQHAHERKVIHRDLKPANVLIQTLEPPGNMEKRGTIGSEAVLAMSSVASNVLKITDFGLAKRLDSESTAWTQDGAVLGTASYMAPEQAAGRARDVGPAADIYGLGAILYELLTGRPPFLGDSWNKTIEQVLYDEPLPLTRLQSDVPRDLETICLKCLEKDPLRRYSRAQELADDLGRFLVSQPIGAVRLSERDRLARIALRDGYEIVREIGRGPRSTVYHALHGPLKQPVALKIIQAGLCTREEWDAQLKRSANLWAILAHPQIVSVHQAGWWADAPYLALEYVAHGSLGIRLAEKKLSVLQSLRWVQQLAEIMIYVHRQGVVHGNLKPSNVLLVTDDTPRLTDFRPTGGMSFGPVPTDSPEFLGLGSLAPELIADPAQELRPHTDIYGLGLILYELLTGRPSFQAATAKETLHQVTTQDPIPPSKLNSEVTPALERCCLRCLHKNPWRRYHRAYDVLMRLKALQKGYDKATSS